MGYTEEQEDLLFSEKNIKTNGNVDISIIYPKIPETVKDVTTITIGSSEIRVISDSSVPKGEIHFVNNGKCIAKIIDDT